MTLKALILLALLSRTPHHLDTETWSEREVRLGGVAEDIAWTADHMTCHGFEESHCTRLWPASRKALAMALVAQAVFESRLAEHVHKNLCRLSIGECDARKWRDPQTGQFVYLQQSFSLWQIKKFSIPSDHWEQIREGIPGTRYAAWYAARRLSSGFRSCGSLEGAFARYAKGNGCHWEESTDRKELWQKLMVANPQRLKANRDAIRKRLQQALPSSEETRVATQQQKPKVEYQSGSKSQ